MKIRFLALPAFALFFGWADIAIHSAAADVPTESDSRLQSDGKGWRLDKAKITDPERPRVLLIGDSILNGYLKTVTASLAGKAYVDAWVNPYNQSEHVNKLLAEVLEEGPYDVIHFNMGLHGWQEGRIKPGTFEPLTKAYVEVIREKLSKAKIIWANSTPVTVKGEPTKLNATINGTIVEHNRMAEGVMNALNVPINDFYSLLVNKLDLARGDQFHWKSEAYQLLAKTVTDSVMRELGAKLPAPALQLTVPIDYQVTQRVSANHGRLLIAGELTGCDTNPTVLEVRIHHRKSDPEWSKRAAKFDGPKFSAAIDAPAGGWFRVDVRLSTTEHVQAEASVEHVGIGEVFVVAGQSNSANHGEEKQSTKTGRVATFDGQDWQLANDPQPGASGRGGSFLPPFGDAMAERLDVPVGFVACGIGATSVREWLPKGATFPNPPTIERRVQSLPNGEWESKGAAFAAFIKRLEPLGPGGFRAVLWHQGESDANQKEPTRTLPGKLYREYLERIIRDSRREIGWDAPWFVAQVSYHVPGDEASPDIRAAQASLWKDGVALEGPDSDALKGAFRQRNGQGVHFSGPGLREHAARWVEKVAPWVEQQLL